MATTFVDYTGDGNATKSFSFPSIKEADIKVDVDGIVKSSGTHYNITSYSTTGGGNVVFTSGNIPSSPALIRIFRDTDVDTAKATFTAGSSVKAGDLNNNMTQILYAAQEEQNQTILASDIKDAAISAAKLAADSVTTAKIVDANVTTAKIADDAVTADKLANSINTEIAANTAKTTNQTHTGDVTGATSLTIANAAVTNAKIANDAINSDKIADNAINSEHYTDGSIDTVHIDDLQVTTAKIANDAIVGGKIADNAINSEHYTDGSIDTAHIADDAVTTDKLANSIVSDITANNAKVTNVSTNLSTSTTTTAVTVASSDGTNATIGEATSSAAGVMSTAHHDKLDGIEAGATGDQTNAEIRAAVEAASDSNVFTDADHSKLNAIEASATADQTDAEIRAAVEAASDSNVFTDADHSKLNAIEAGATADQTSGEIKALLQSDKLTASEIATGALDGRYFTETELTNGALDGRYFTETEADARYFNISTGDTIKDGDTFPDNDTTIATTAAINDRIIDLVDDVGGFVPIASETAFPSANPDVNNGSGTLVSIKAIGSTRTPSGGTVTISNGAGSSTVTITGCGSTVLTAGFGVIVETTSTLHTYAFHRLVPKATEVTTVAANATNIAAAGANVTNITAVKNNETNINTVAGISSNVTTVAGVASNVTTVAGISSDVTAVANDATDIGVVAGKATEIGRLGTADAVADMNTLGTSAIVSDMDTLADISSNITTVANNSSNVTTVAGISGNVTTVAGNNANVTTVAGANSNITTVAGSIANVNTAATNISNVNNFANTYQIASSNPSTDGGGNSLAAGDLYFNTSANELKVYNGSSWQGGVTATGNLAGLGSNTFTGNQSHGDNVKARFGDSNDLEISHTGGDSLIHDTGTGNLQLKSDSGQVQIFTDGTKDSIICKHNSGVDIFFNNVKKLETVSGGIDVTGNITVSGTVDGVDIAALNTTVSNITSNATHSGEVTGSTALTIADNVVDEANLKVSNSPTNGYFLQAQSGNTGGLTWAAVSQPDSDKITEGNTEAEVVDTGSDGHFKVTTEGSERFRIDSSGRIMIGTTDPGQANADELTIAGASTCGITIRGAASGNSLIYFSDATGANDSGQYAGYLVYDHTNNKLNIGTNSSARLSVDSTGNFLPWSDSTNNIGSNSVRFANGYFDTLYGDGSNLTGISSGVSSDSDNNTLGGTGAGNNLASGANRNTFFGKEAGEATSTGDDNVAFGAYSLLNNTTQGNNTAIGYAAQYYNTGSNCIAVGSTSLFRGTGNHNIGIGYYTGYALTSGNENIIIGNYAGQAFTEGQANVAIGHDALSATVDANDNVAIGKNAISEGDAGNSNTAVGYQSLMFTTGSGSVAVGNSALRGATSSSSNTAVGTGSMYNTWTGSGNVAVGYDALRGGSSPSGENNVGIGRYAGEDITTGNSNAYVGTYAGKDITTGSGNACLGYEAGVYLTSGSTYNVAIGQQSGAQGANVIGSIAIGRRANAGSDNYNTVIGYDAGLTGTSLAHGGNNILIGYQCQASSATVDNEITLGNSSITKFRIPGINFILKDNGGTPTNGHVLTVDSNGEAGFAAAGVTLSAINSAITGGEITPANIKNPNGNLRFESQSGRGFEMHDSNNYVYPLHNNSTGLGQPSRIWKNLYVNEVFSSTRIQSPFYENSTTVTADYTVTNGYNAMAAGPLTINSGVTVTVGSGETLTIV